MNVAADIKMRFLLHLRAKGVMDPRVLSAMEQVDRGAFLKGLFRERAYEDVPLAIGCGQTISQPSIVAIMTEALDVQPRHKVLEIGTGSGYQAAILSRLASRVVSVERIPRLAARARSALDAVGVANVIVQLGDGTQGWPQEAPYDRVVVTAGGPEIPLPLLSQLAEGGVLVGPFGPRGGQELVRMRRTGETRFTREVLGRCRFVDLIGANGCARYSGIPLTIQEAHCAGR